MAWKRRRVVASRAAVVLLLAGITFHFEARAQFDPRAPFNLPADRRVESFARIIRFIDQRATEASSAIELAAIDQLVGRARLGYEQTFRNDAAGALRQWTACNNASKTSQQRMADLDAAIAAERVRVSASSPTAEESALEGVIAQTKAELAGLEGRLQRVPLLEKKLQAMPVTGFMDSAPREALEAELAAARANVPRPGEVDRARADLAKYEADLRSERARRPVPNRGELARLEQQRGAVQAAWRLETACAADQKKAFIRARAQALGFIELFEWLDAIVARRREALAGATGTPSALSHCVTMQGPFRCTGAFDGSWSSRCTTSSGPKDANGPARVSFGPDGWVEVRMTDATPQQGATPTIVGGKISADGKVVIERLDPGHTEIYRGEFKLVTSTLASGAAKPIGGGTYESVVRTANGQEIMRCTGAMKLY